MATAAIATGFASPVYAAEFFVPGDLVISGSTYDGTASTVTVGQTLPGSTTPAVANGSYPGVFKNVIPIPALVSLRSLSAGGLQKWSLVNGTWQEDYNLQAGLNLGQQYTVAGLPTSYDPATY